MMREWPTLPQVVMYCVVQCTSPLTWRFPSGHFLGLGKSWGWRVCTTQYIPTRGSVHLHSKIQIQIQMHWQQLFTALSLGSWRCRLRLLPQGEVKSTYKIVSTSEQGGTIWRIRCNSKMQNAKQISSGVNAVTCIYTSIYIYIHHIYDKCEESETRAV